MRDEKGRFIKGQSYSVSTQFEKGVKSWNAGTYKGFICEHCRVTFFPKDYAKRRCCSRECLRASGILKGKIMPVGAKATNWRYGCEEFYRIKARKIMNRIDKKDDYVVHHVDGNIKNNNPYNLKVLSRREHAKLHWLMRNNKGGTISAVL